MKHIIENVRDYFSLGVEVIKKEIGNAYWDLAEDIGYNFHKEHKGWFENGNYIWYDINDSLALYDADIIKAVLEIFTAEDIENNDNYFDCLDDVKDDVQLGKYVVDNLCTKIDKMLLPYINFEKLGKDFRESNAGDFTSKGYIYMI